MKKTELRTTVKKMLSDIYTPVGIYLRLRDRFRDTILLESTDSHVAENSYSFIGINAIGGIEVANLNEIEFKLPIGKTELVKIDSKVKIPTLLWEYMQKYDVEEHSLPIAKMAQGLFGYSCYEAVQFFENIKLKGIPEIPLMRYRLYQYVVVINHFKDELFICENHVKGLESEEDIIEGLIKSKDIPTYPFQSKNNETSNLTDPEYMDMVKEGIASCYRGDVFQVVLSRRFQQGFTGDDFNVYRSLRSVNPSPYLFHFDYGDYKIMGSSPESQVIIKDGKVIVHPIAGTFKRTGDDVTDARLAEELLKDKKENAEHTMLVDLARNDLSKICEKVEVTQRCKIQYYSHVIHMVSEVTGYLTDIKNPFEVIAATYPAGTLSGAPKYKAMQLINEGEKTPRGYYGGCLGFVGFNGDLNHAIMIRSILSKSNVLTYQAGAGVVASSQPESELKEVNNKLGALKNAIELAQNI